MAEVLEAALGAWGSALVSIRLIVSVLAAYLAWRLMSAEVLFMAAKTRDVPRFPARSSAAARPRPPLPRHPYHSHPTGA